MNKYAAVIKDAFREAFASRVLWLVLVLITLLLLVIAPLGYREDLTWRLRDSDVREWPDLLEKVREAADENKPSPAGRIWGLLDEDLQPRVAVLKIPGKDADALPFEFIDVLSTFQKSVNEIIQARDFYDDQSFDDVPLLSDELRELRDVGIAQLSDQEVARFNRLLVEASFTEMVRTSSPTSIQWKYGWKDVLSPLPMRGRNLREILGARVHTAISWLVGVIGVLVAVLVTAAIIPQMFDQGSLHLLLSKPVARWLLFLARYLGGCVFILIGAAYLIGGFWLILGIRFGIWEPRLLLAIPIYVFVFSVYYSVSAFSGVIWRNAIAAVAMTVIFFLLCWGVGWAKFVYDRAVTTKDRFIRAVQVDDQLLAVSEAGVVHEWDEAERQWRAIYVSADQKQMLWFVRAMPSVPRELRPLGPIVDTRHELLLSAHPPLPPAKVQLYAWTRGEQWEASSNLTVPTGTIGMFRERDGGILLVSRLGLYRLIGDPTKQREQVKLFGMKIPFGIGSPFRTVSPDPPVLLTQPGAAAMNNNTGELALYTRGTISIVRPEQDGTYGLRLEHKLDGEERQPVAIAFAGDQLVLGRDDGRIQVLDAETLAERQQFQPEGPNQPRFLTASPDGRWFAILYHNGRLWLFDAQSGAMARPRVSGQGDISCAVFSSDSRLLVGDRAERISEYALGPVKLERRYTPQLGMLATAYRYGLVPLYTVFPKPGELDVTFQYLLSGKETETGSSDDLASSQQDLNPWTPLWSSALFTVILLAVACVYIEWQEF